MKTTISFSGTEEEAELIRQHLDGPRAFSVLWEFDEELRRKLKYEELSDEEHKIYSEIRQSLLSAITESGIDV